MSTKKPVTRGRPRDEALRVKIITTTVAILMDGGLSRATMNEIAARAQIGKQTLYRWWKNRAELLMEALRYSAEKSDASRADDPAELSLRAFLEKTFGAVNAAYGAILKSLIAESMADRDFFKIFLKEFILKRQEALLKVLRKEIPAENCAGDYVNTVVDMIFGAMWYRLLFEHRPLDGKFAENISRIVTGNRPKSVGRSGAAK